MVDLVEVEIDASDYSSRFRRRLFGDVLLVASALWSNNWAAVEDWGQLAISLKCLVAVLMFILLQRQQGTTVPTPDFSFTHELEHLYLPYYTTIELICSVPFN